jgi:hypothetical protein
MVQVKFLTTAEIDELRNRYKRKYLPMRMVTLK